MKPPKLKKLSKKELRKEYTRQWREAIRANGEIYKANQTNEGLEKYIKATENQVRIAENAMERMQQETKVRIEEKEKILKTISRIVNWNARPILEGREYVIIDHEEYQNMVVRIQDLERHNQDLMEEKSYFQEKKEELEKKCYVQEESIEDWKEATRRARNLYESYKQFGEKQNREKNSIEQMAKNMYRMNREDYMREGAIDIPEWEEQEEDIKDTYRVRVTRIVSEDQDKEKSSI